MLDRLDTDNPLTLLAALIIGVIAVGRATRLAVHDHYPPMVAVRTWWWNQTTGRGGKRADWNLVLVGDTPDEPGCPFCFAPYAAAVNLAWVLLAGLSGDGFWSAAWWVVNVWAAVAYAAAILYARDQPAED